MFVNCKKKTYSMTFLIYKNVLFFIFYPTDLVVTKTTIPLRVGEQFYNHRQNQLGRLYNLTVVHFNPEKTEFSLLLNIPRPPYSMLGYNRTITRTNINVLINTGPGAGGGRKRSGKKGNLPNTSDDDCRYIPQHFASRYILHHYSPTLQGILVEYLLIHDIF